MTDSSRHGQDADGGDDRGREFAAAGKNGASLAIKTEEPYYLRNKATKRSTQQQHVEDLEKLLDISFVSTPRRPSFADCMSAARNTR